MLCCCEPIVAMASRGALAVFFFFFFFASLRFLLTAATTPAEILSSSEYFLSTHAAMLSSFKIFIYPQIPGYAEADLRAAPAAHPATTPDLFFQSLSSSDFITEDPEAAHLFFIPVSIEAMAEKMKTQSVGRSLRGLVQELRDRYPFWQRALGADHFIACCSRFKSDLSRNVLELQKNSIWLACAELFGREEEASLSHDEGSESQFFPHKDIAMPPYSHLAMTQATLEGVEHGVGRLSDRAFLMYLMDRPSPGSPAFALWGGDTDIVLQSSNSTDMLLNSKFCLTFASMGHNISLVDAMRKGCVPVIVSHGYLHGLPFQDILDWDKFAVIASSMHLHKLKAYLNSMPEGKYREMQRAAKEASTLFEWQMPPRSFDAFHMLVYQLWLRRHAIRYTRRNAE